MIRRTLALSSLLSLCLAPLAQSQGLVIDHKEVGCIVVGKYPKMNACFSPASGVARSRVYFRPEGTPSWYYVDMKSDAPCFAGVLPRPGKKLVGKKIEYYVEAQDKTFNPARTAEYGPVVVQSAQECKKELPVAPFLNNATVAVFPALPAGFVGGGIGTAAVVGIAAAGAAAAGTAAVVASNDDDTTTTTAPIAIVTTTTTLAPAATTTTTTTLPTVGNRPPFAVLATNPDPVSGNTPLTVTFDLCKSTDPDGDSLSFFFDFGDGSQSSGSCLETHKYVASSSADVRRAANFEFTGSVVDPSGASAARSRTVVVQPPPPPTTTPTAPCVDLTITLNSPADGDCFTGLTVPVSATATGASQVTFQAIKCGDGCGCCLSSDGSTTVSGSGPRYSSKLAVSEFGEYLIQATATSVCGRPSVTTARNRIDVQPSCGTALLSVRPRSAAGWSSDLSVEGGRLQLVVNGAAAAFPGRGRASGVANLIEGENRIEATLVEGSGKAGVWRFDLVNGRTTATESIRVVSGDVVSVSATSVTFRLDGHAGARVVFTFRR